MKAKKFYSGLTDAAKLVKGYGSLRAFLLFGLLWLSVSASGQVSYVGGSPQSLSVCQSSGGTPINSFLGINDPATGLTETWSVTSGPSNGAITTGSTAPSGNDVTPTGWAYTPTTGYSGTDAFTIMVSNGTTTASTTINVTVNALPAVSGGSNVAICIGSSTPLTATGGTSYSWSPSAGLSATTGANVVASPTVTTTYTVTGFNAPSPVVYSQAFVNGVAPSSQCTAWATFRASLNSSYSYTGFTIRGSQNATGISCTDPVVAAAVANALNTGTPYTGTSDGQTWTVTINGCTMPACGSISVELANQGGCTCASGYSIRPSINNSNWGGIDGLTCGALSQTMEVDFYTTGCSNTAMVTVSVNPLPVITTSAGSGFAICNGANPLITASGGTYYSWSPSTGLSATTGASVVANPSVTTTYTVTGTNGATLVYNQPFTGGATYGPSSPQGIAWSNFVASLLSSGCTGFTMKGSNDPVGVTCTDPVTAQNIADALRLGTTYSGSSDGFNWVASDACCGPELTNTGSFGNCMNPGYTVRPDIANDNWGGINTTTCGAPTQTMEVDFYFGTGCSNSTTFTVTVNPAPDAISGPSNFCLGSPVTLTDDSTGGKWTSSNTFATVDSTFGTVSGDSLGLDTISYTLPDGCFVTLAGSVNPIPGVNPIAAIAPYCNGATTDSVLFSGTPNTVFNWVNSNPSIGLPASDSGNINPFTIIDTGSVPVTAYFTVLPAINGCLGGVQSFSMTVYPTPNVNASANQTVCNGTPTAAISFTGTVDGTTFTWTNSDTTIGLGSTDTGNIASFTGIDTSSAPVTSVVTVSTSANGCTGSSNSFTITIDPTPLLSSALTASICDSTMLDYMPGSATAGTTFNWSRDSVAGISNSANSGMDDPYEMLYNTTANPVTDTYVYALQAYGCVDTQNVVVTVNPHQVLSSSLTPPSICDSTLFHYIPSSLTTGVAYSWSRDSIAGISNSAGTGIDSMNEVLVNVTPNPITVTYVDTLTLNGCWYTQNITVAVNPKPMLSTSLTLPTICDSTLFTYVSASGTTGTDFTWSRGTITGISNPAASGGDTINEILVNQTADPILVTYVDTLKANGCMNTEDVSVLVRPRLILSSLLTPAGICDSMIFNYTPASATAGTTFTWVRPMVLGILEPTASGPGNPDEQLINTTNDNLDVTYNYTINDSGCTNTQNVIVVVHPTPVLSSPLTPSVCSGAAFYYVDSSYTFGTTTTWTRGRVAGISPATGTGSGNISETLTDSLSTPVTTVYDIILTANGCQHSELLTVTVNPAPPGVSITTFPPNALCSSTMYQNYGTSTAPPSGQSYSWSAQNATIYAEGQGHQYILVNFDNPGQAVITLNTHLAGYGCTTNNSDTVNVGSDVSDMPQVIYFDGQLVCLQNNMDSYQWGYDDAVTLDSALIPGEINPNYFISAPDLTYKYYWVITTHNGCMQKTYYNVPPVTGVSNVNVADASIKVYPNPASSRLNVEINSTTAGNYNVDVVDILGQKVQNANVTDHKATVDVSGLAAGVYMVVCHRDGVTIGTVRFVKN